MTKAKPETRDTPLLKLIAPAVPYVAVFIGLYVLSSGWASILLYHAGMVIILTVTRTWVRPGMSRTSACRRALVVMVAGAALVGPVLYAAWSSMHLPGFELADELADLGLARQWWILFILYYFTVNPVLEETFWRGYLGNASKGPVWTDGFFAAYHVLVIAGFVTAPWVVVGFLGLVGAAWLLRQVTRDCGGLLIAIIAHGVADASLIWAAFFLGR